MRFTLPKSEMLRGYRSFTRVITSGNSASAPPLRCYYTRTSSSPSRILVGFSASRKFKRAVDRNRAKRLMRESYRLTRRLLEDGITRKNELLEIVFMYVGNRLAPTVVGSIDTVDEAMKRLIATITGNEER